MATADITIHVNGIPQFAGLVQAAIAVRDELRTRGDHCISAKLERQLNDALMELGVVTYD